MTDAAVEELTSHVAVLLRAGSAPWTTRNTRHWATWVGFCKLRELDPRVDADPDRLLGYALAALENGSAPKTVRDHLRSIVRITESAPPSLKTRFTAAADAQALTRVWTRLGRDPRRRPAPVVPLGHLLAMARWLREHDPVAHAWLAAAYSRGLRSGEPLRIVTDSIDVREHAVRAFVDRTKTRPRGEWVELPRLVGWGTKDELDVAAALEALPVAEGRYVIDATVDALARRLRKAAAAVGVTEWATRTPRRSRATHVLLDGGDHTLIQWLLRHDDPKTTTGYIDALWGYAYDGERARAVLLNAAPPTGGPVPADAVKGPQPARTRRRPVEFAASELTTTVLTERGRELLDEHSSDGRVYSRGYLRAGQRFIAQFDDWCVETLGRTVEIADSDGETALLLHVTARLRGQTAFTDEPHAVSDAFDAALAVLGDDAPALPQVRRALAGARRSTPRHKVPTRAATAGEVVTLLHDVPSVDDFGRLSAADQERALMRARENLAWAGAFSSAARQADMRQVRLEGMSEVPGLGWVAYLAVSKGARHQPTERDVLVFPRRADRLDLGEHLAAMLALREAAGIDEPWLLARTKPGCDSSRPIDDAVLKRALERRRAEVGLPWVTGHSLRHGRIVELADAGSPLEELRRWLRHRDHQTVPVYAAQARPGWLWRHVMAAVEAGT